MNTYSEKLKDPRWHEFRRRAFDFYGYQCTTCGEDSEKTDRHHVHHLRYMKGREPWEYDLRDVTILCKNCHDEVHQAENLFRDLIRRSPSWLAYHFIMFGEALEQIDASRYPGVLGRAKCDARRIQYGGED